MNTPATEEVRHMYLVGKWPNTPYHYLVDREGTHSPFLEFDRWLAEHDARVAAKAAENIAQAIAAEAQRRWRESEGSDVSVQIATLLAAARIAQEVPR